MISKISRLYLSRWTWTVPLAFILSILASDWETCAEPIQPVHEVIPPPNPLYETRENHLPDGTGKFFLDREIAYFMSHLAASWLERPEREEEEAPSKLLNALKITKGMLVGDVGAGSGFFSWRLAELVGPSGIVYATDIQPEMLAILQTNVLARGLTNVVSVLGTDRDPKLPSNRLDLILMVDVYHEFDHPYEMMLGLVDSLKPGGRIVFVEYRGEEKWIPIKPTHKLTEAQVKKEMKLHAVDWVETLRLLPRQHVILFKKRGTPLDAAPADRPKL